MLIYCINKLTVINAEFLAVKVCLQTPFVNTRVLRRREMHSHCMVMTHCVGIFRFVVKGLLRLGRCVFEHVVFDYSASPFVMERLHVERKHGIIKHGDLRLLRDGKKPLRDLPRERNCIHRTFHHLKNYALMRSNVSTLRALPRKCPRQLRMSLFVADFRSSWSRARCYRPLRRSFRL